MCSYKFSLYSLYSNSSYQCLKCIIDKVNIKSIIKLNVFKPIQVAVKGDKGGLHRQKAATNLRKPLAVKQSNVPTKSRVTAKRDVVTKPAPAKVVPKIAPSKLLKPEVTNSPVAMIVGTPIKEQEGQNSNVFDIGLNPAVENIDENDSENPQLCSEFVNDIYHYMLYLEAQHPVQQHYLKDTGLKGRMRSILVDWLIQVHHRFNLLQETLYLTIAILDRFLQVQIIVVHLQFVC